MPYILYNMIFYLNIVLQKARIANNECGFTQKKLDELYFRKAELQWAYFHLSEKDQIRRSEGLVYR